MQSRTVYRFFHIHLCISITVGRFVKFMRKGLHRIAFSVFRMVTVSYIIIKSSQNNKHHLSREEGMLKNLLKNIFRLMPAEVLHCSESKSKVFNHLFTVKPALDLCGNFE